MRRRSCAAIGRCAPIPSGARSHGPRRTRFAHCFLRSNNRASHVEARAARARPRALRSSAPHMSLPAHTRPRLCRHHRVVDEHHERCGCSSVVTPRACAAIACSRSRLRSSCALAARYCLGQPTSVIADLGRLGQRPRRVGEVRPRDRAQVGAAGGDDAVDVVGLGDRADRDGRRCRPRCGCGRRTASGTCGRRPASAAC